MPEELCEAEPGGFEAAQQTNGSVNVTAFGFHPSQGYKVKFKEVDAPPGTFPPEFNLVHTPPAEQPSEPEETVFNARTIFFAPTPVRHVIVNDRRGRHQVRVEQPLPPERPDPPPDN
jgi:hypothetical protein